jgi:hypothetical protein
MQTPQPPRLNLCLPNFSFSREFYRKVTSRVVVIPRQTNISWCYGSINYLRAASYKLFKAINRGHTGAYAGLGKPELGGVYLILLWNIDTRLSSLLIYCSTSNIPPYSHTLGHIKKFCCRVSRGFHSRNLTLLPFCVARRLY